MIDRRFFFLFLTLSSLAFLTGCYLPPGENEFSVVPTTNNPAVTCEKQNSMIPSVGY